MKTTDQIKSQIYNSKISMQQITMEQKAICNSTTTKHKQYGVVIHLNEVRNNKLKTDKINVRFLNIEHIYQIHQTEKMYTATEKS